MKIIGLLLIVNALILCAWWMIEQNANKSWVVGVTLIAIFCGIFLLVSDRSTEVSVRGVGSIKAAATAAEADAQQVAEIRKRVENQSATIDMVAAKATQAQALTEEVKRVLDFTVTVQKALADDRPAFDALAKYIDQHSELSAIAANVYTSIRSDAGGPIEPGFLNLPEGHPLYAATKIEDIRVLYAKLHQVYRPNAITLVLNNAQISNSDKLILCLDVLRSDPSLMATNIAGKFAAKQTDSIWRPFQVQPLIDRIQEQMHSK